MKTTSLKNTLLAFAFLFSTAAFAQSEKTVTVGGAAMYPSKNIVENAVNSKDHTTLVAAVKAAGLVETLSGKGPFTVFAPVNEAFDALPAGTVDQLLKPENKDALTNVLTYHVVPGRIDSASLMEMIKDGKGKAMAKTVQGEELTFSKKGKGVQIMDSKGNKAMVTIKDVYQSNGVIHVIDTVLMP
ncbi:putative surface protein with fasciclin (FAS1) repeats [Dyadobacter jejuensis]|uniref:Putative surface protein with fasciclin (FAS1) repeats n=1 Tax=Dyadobacter jejuensis TaxID=1082580 RepID=A0A316A6M5_9BACT|nr:fasciclin domain-containing protein [Dyadobacter jejuensis]PWJ53586.1 putative surface protein with fasciclin (FAS1) repeats [Dyadobacter jejuensis]